MPSLYSLFGKKVKDTYPRLLQITEDNTVLDGSGDTRSLFVQGNFSASTYYSGSTPLSEVIQSFVTAGTDDITRVQPGLNTYTGGTNNFPTVNISALTISTLSVSGSSVFSSLSATSISGGTIFSGSTPLQTIIQNMLNSGDMGEVLGLIDGINTFTGGTPSYPSINITGASLNNIFVSGSSLFNSLSATTLYSGSTELGVIMQRFISADQNDITRVQPGSNITTGGTDNFPVINLVANPFVNNLNSSGTSLANLFSATTISGGTFFSGSTSLETIIARFNDGNDITRVQPGSNITTGGTANFPIISTVSNPVFSTLSASSISGTSVWANSLTATTISGGTLFSGTTELGVVIQRFVGNSSITLVQPGFNTYTGGTSSAPTVNVSALTIDNLSVTGTSTTVFTGGIRSESISATTVSGGTIFSGSTNLESIFHQKAGYLLQKAGSVTGSTFSGNPKKATVTFTTSFPSTSYAVNVTGEVNRTWVIESKAASGFTISANSNAAFASSNVFWIASEIGEGFK